MWFILIFLPYFCKGSSESRLPHALIFSNLKLHIMNITSYEISYCKELFSSLLRSQLRAHLLSKLLHNLVCGAFYLLRSQSLLGRADGQPDGHRFFGPPGICFPLYSSTKAGVLQERARLLLTHDRVIDIRPCGVRIKEHGNIIISLRILCKMGEPVRFWTSAEPILSHPARRA